MFKSFTLASLALAALYWVSPVVGHGYVTVPPSRQARCHNGEVTRCGGVEYEPQSVEALAGSFACNGDGHRFHELNDNSLFENLFFTVPEGTESLPFTWVLPAPHRTLVWEYFVITQENALLLSDPGHGAVPPQSFTHLVPLNGIKGRQTVLARWTIADTPNAFYACVDLLIEGSETATAVAGAVATPVPIAMPYGFHNSLGHENSANRSESATAETSRAGSYKAIQNLLYVQGPQS
uniref:Chitin-binding type-4 domain-containing protein n=1 Tax=Psilocybe cubensis TaxID=181762 RepID=A0A8H7XVR9_PSICU